MKHVSHCGIYAGRPICGAPKSGETGGHAVYFPWDNEQRRNELCQACVFEYLASFDPDQLPSWSKNLLPTTVEGVAWVEKNLSLEGVPQPDPEVFRANLKKLCQEVCDSMESDPSFKFLN